MDAQQRLKLHIGEMTIAIHALQADLEKLQAEHEELKKKVNPDQNQPA